MTSYYNTLRANTSLIIENSCISKYLSEHFKTTIFSVEAIKTKNVLSTLDRSAGVDQIHIFTEKDYESFATSNRICFVKDGDPTKYFKIKYKRSNNKTEYDIWKIYNDKYFSNTGIDIDIYPIIPSYFIQSFVDLELKYKIKNLLKKGYSVDKCIELIENKKTDFDINDYIKEIAYAKIKDILEALDLRLFEEKVITEGNTKLHWAYVNWMDVRDLRIIF